MKKSRRAQFLMSTMLWSTATSSGMSLASEALNAVGR